MNDQDFPRILAAVDGYWPNAAFKSNAQKAWKHLLRPFAADAILDALSDYASEGHPFPPVAGQLAARISPPSARGTGERETELERARRQRAYAVELVKVGKMPQADFDFYEADYWRPTIDQHTRAA